MAQLGTGTEFVPVRLPAPRRGLAARTRGVIALPPICTGTPALPQTEPANIGTTGETAPVLTGAGTPGVSAVEAGAASMPYPAGGEIKTTALGARAALSGAGGATSRATAASSSKDFTTTSPSPESVATASGDFPLPANISIWTRCRSTSSRSRWFSAQRASTVTWPSILFSAREAAGKISTIAVSMPTSFSVFSSSGLFRGVFTGGC
mmetsp:Transcript_49517/g.78390  ORF Transcript_49517/g.78390 Transcript_49517/m.78390 type:complete len:208 (+) Transcript_49517:845-1468(+)